MSQKNVPQESKTRPSNNLKKKIAKPVIAFINDSRAVGVVLIACTIISLILSNVNFSQAAYTGFWETSTQTKGFLNLPGNFLLWVNDALMAVFFLTVGTEIKRELMVGELASIKKSMLPICAALGGILVPAFIYYIFNGSTPYHHGWGIPMATDIAFSLGVLSLLGDKAPLQLKVFLAALAIIDDLGAILVIAIFYSSHLSLIFLFCGLGGVVLLLLFNKFKVKSLVPYILVGLVVWYCILNSGVHATIAGVLVAFCIPVKEAKFLEGKLSRFVDFIVMPLFALANTAIIFPNQMSHIISSPIAIGVFLGLVIGKPVGILLFSFLSTKLKIAALPKNTSWIEMSGVGAIAGIGFTMSIFISTLAFSEVDIQDIAKISVLIASTVAGILGYLFLSKIEKEKLEHQLSHS